MLRFLGVIPELLLICMPTFLWHRVKSGGPDPVSNSKLNELLKQAKVLGVPKDVIDRNIKRASDAKQGDYQECIYEAYGPAGTGEDLGQGQHRVGVKKGA